MIMMLLIMMIVMIIMPMIIFDRWKWLKDMYDDGNDVDGANDYEYDGEYHID